MSRRTSCLSRSVLLHSCLMHHLLTAWGKACILFLLERPGQVAQHSPFLDPLAGYCNSMLSSLSCSMGAS